VQIPVAIQFYFATGLCNAQRQYFRQGKNRCEYPRLRNTLEQGRRWILDRTLSFVST